MPLPPEVVVQSLIKSTTRYLEWLEESRGQEQTYQVEGITETEDRRIPIEGELYFAYQGHAPQHLRFNRDSLVVLLVEGAEHEARILNYHKTTGRIAFCCPIEISASAGQIVVNFRWLIQRVLQWLENRGPSLCGIDETEAAPDIAPLPMPPEASEEQERAISATLANSLSYVWGPPGTGKSRMVLSMSVLNCIAADQTVLVLAPTNLAVDNAMDAVIERLDDPRVALRLGTPTTEFVERHPMCCEQQLFREQADEAQRRIRDAEEEIALLQDKTRLVGRINTYHEQLKSGNAPDPGDQNMLADLRAAILNQSQADLEYGEILSRQLKVLVGIASELDEIRFGNARRQLDAVEEEYRQLILEEQELRQQEKGLRWFDRITSKPRKIASAKTACDARRGRVEITLDGLRSQEAIAQQRRAELLQDLHTMEPLTTDAGMGQRIRQIEAEILHQKTIIQDFEQDLATKRVLGMTLDAFIGLTLRQPSLNADHVFVDEAAYAPLAKVIPLLSLHCPISLLGDHLQLPPICENKSDSTIRSFWAKRATFLEDAFELGDNHDQLNSKSDCQLDRMTRVKLTRSYRFGPRLAQLLDDRVYRGIGLQGFRNSDTCIRTLDCPPRMISQNQDRQNQQEAQAIVDRVQMWLEHPNTAGQTLAVLTPYNDQRRLLRRQLRPLGAHDRIDVLNIHESQGREWDWVLFSVVDTEALGDRHKPWFTDDLNPRSEGLALLNTAFSRARKELRFFMDAQYWSQCEPKRLLTHIVEQFPPS